LLENLLPLNEEVRKGDASMHTFFIEYLKKFPTALKLALTGEVVLPQSYLKVKCIVISGMGGSAAAGDIVKDWLYREVNIPIEVVKGYNLPAYADENTLLICVSYSGDTWETLTQFEQGWLKGCRLVAISSGGALKARAEELKTPYVEVPRGLLPRLALPQLLAGIIKVLRSIGIVGEVNIEGLEGLEPMVRGYAEKLAMAIKDKTPIAISVYPSVCFRFKTQLNENAKILAKCEVLPELNHNEVESWVNLSPGFTVIAFRDEREEAKKVKEAIEVLKEVVSEKASWFDVYAEGTSRLERILHLVWLGDYTSYLAAIQRGINPVKIDIIELLKKRVAKIR